MGGDAPIQASNVYFQAPFLVNVYSRTLGGEGYHINLFLPPPSSSQLHGWRVDASQFDRAGGFEKKTA
jgi:hypothetical protein